jgi:hypothetical protein
MVMDTVHYTEDTPLPLMCTCTAYRTVLVQWSTRQYSYMSLIRNSLPGGNHIELPAAKSTGALIPYPRLGATFRGRVGLRHSSIAGEVRSPDA